jgi:hypothetical protein
MSGTLWLGPLTLQGFELPGSIAWGGGQRLAVHRLPGGARVIDALGRDDAQITWSGVFAGADAAIRARLVDLVRADGSVWPLSWAGFFYSVVVASFHADFARSNWIPYRIACTVLRDEAEAVVEMALSLGANALADLSAADGFGAVDLSGSLGALAADGAGTPGTGAYGAATGSLLMASGAIEGGMTQAGAALVAAPLGTPDGLYGAAGAAGQLAALAGARGYVRRAQANLAQADAAAPRN